MLKLYNTLTRKKEEFKPIKKNQVGMYTCGPTVYDYAHIGNFRAYTVADLLQRYLEYKGFKVKWVMNLTDVDDKTITGAKKEGISLDKYTKRYKKAFFEDLASLNIEKAAVYPEATKHIKEMVNLVKKLLKKGLAYRKEGSIYYNISKFKDYGKFAHIDLSGIKPGARVDVDEYEKEKAQDFVLWKGYKEGEPSWDTEIGKGRPGWHLECSVMSTKYLGQPFDIHTGGVDLIFPHHQNEIAQSEGAEGKKFANFWIHNEFLLVEGEKMAKSLGNIYTLRNISKKGYSPIHLRYLYLTGHYRDKLNFTWAGLESAKSTLDGLYDFIQRILEIGKSKESNKKVVQTIGKNKKEFVNFMDDDLNTPKALASIFEMVKEVNKIGIDNLGKKDARLIYETLLDFDRILGLGLKEMEIKIIRKITKKLTYTIIGEVPAEVSKAIEEREEARKKGNFKKADKIRADLLKQGIELEDTPSGTRIVKIKK